MRISRKSLSVAFQLVAPAVSDRPERKVLNDVFLDLEDSPVLVACDGRRLHVCPVEVQDAPKGVRGIRLCTALARKLLGERTEYVELPEKPVDGDTADYPKWRLVMPSSKGCVVAVVDIGDDLADLSTKALKPPEGCRAIPKSAKGVSGTPEPDLEIYRGGAFLAVPFIRAAKGEDERLDAPRWARIKGVPHVVVHEGRRLELEYPDLGRAFIHVDPSFMSDALEVGRRMTVLSDMSAEGSPSIVSLPLRFDSLGIPGAFALVQPRRL
jgi:hypothetical protein